MGNLGKLKELENLESFEDERINKIDDKLVDLVFVLDKSGSMWGSESDVIGGFNSLITKEKKLHPNTIVTLVFFDTEYKVIYTRKDISEVEELTSDVYYADGCTALLDAVGTTINRLDKIAHDNVLFVIATDGQENSSKEYTRRDIKKMITSHDWEFISLEQILIHSVRQVAWVLIQHIQLIMKKVLQVLVDYSVLLEVQN